MNTNSVVEYYQLDHGRLDGLFKEFQTTKATDFDRAAARFAEFKAGLERHIVWEEEILFPGFEAKTGMRNVGPTAVMRMEHQVIKKHLEEIAGKLKNHDVNTDAEESGLLETLGAHNMKEENILYPAIDRLLNEIERTDVFARMEKVAA